MQSYLRNAAESTVYVKTRRRAIRTILKNLHGGTNQTQCEPLSWFVKGKVSTSADNQSLRLPRGGAGDRETKGTFLLFDGRLRAGRLPRKG